MKIEIMLYVYLAVCAAMIIFNIVCIFVFRRNDKQLNVASKDICDIIKKQLDLINDGKNPDEEHLFYISKKLKKVGSLLAFDRAMEKIYKDKPDICKEYFKSTKSAFISLAESYKNKDVVKASYFPYFVGKYGLLKIDGYEKMMDIMTEYLSMPSIYARQNALIAICSSENPNAILTALKILDRQTENKHNPKLISEEILRYTTNHDEVCELLIANIGNFSTQMQVALINLCRLCKCDFTEKMLEMLKDDNIDDEIRFACIRYFGTVKSDTAYPLLLKMNNIKNVSRWEYVAITSTALSAYKSNEAIESLKKNLNSENWYIRLNSATSLESFGLKYTDFTDIFEGNDRYAREILRYKMDESNFALSGGGNK